MAILGEHHIIPKRFAGHDALKGIDINAPENLIYLPESKELAARMGVSPHSGGHLSSYYDVKTILDQIARIRNPSRRQTEIRNLQDAMRLGLANGDLYANDPGTGADPESINPKLITRYNDYHAVHPDQVRKLAHLRQRGIDTGNPNLEKFSAILGDDDREKLLSEAIAKNPGVNITTGNKDLGGTHWQSKFTVADDIFNVPPSTPAKPSDAPSLPPFSSPSLGGLNEPEGLDRNDPRLANGLPGFPVPNPNEQRLGQLPPSTAMPSAPQVLQFHSETGNLLRLSDGSPLMGPDPYNMPHDAASGPAVLAGLAIFGTAMFAPELLPLLPAWAPIAGALGLTGLAANSAAHAEPTSSREPGAFRVAPLAAQQSANNVRSQNPTPSSTFADRFGNWTDATNGTLPAQPASGGEAPAVPAAQAVPPEQVRQLTRVNASNAGSVFTSGSAPVPYLPSPEFNDRFGNWSTTSGDGQSPPTSRPVGAFADEPGYVIPPPIWGIEQSANPRKDAEEWFSRWIRPLL
ncbi:AHH domain-containing protein [Bradyrhizobium commune]|uniref:AHH domain-containing protein n=1 Tax=Bradyrhizobium commune TaxID=83627 RepID=A0A7S9D9L2_9BRAD|nr:AHH domain-containing protein [Bradyrhizobium commune]QPF93758.1 AHH domain-containing protein [Bradyrhizobium commune]